MKLSSMIGVTCFGLLFLPLLFVQAQERRSPNEQLTSFASRNESFSNAGR